MQSDLSQDELSEIQGWIAGLISHFETSAFGLSRKAGITQSVLSRIINGETNRPSAETLSRLAAVSPVPAPSIVQRKLDFTMPKRREQSVNIHTDKYVDQIPVWGVFPIERDGEFQINAIPVTWLQKPSASNRSLKLAAFYAPDDTMGPRWTAGEPVLFDRARPASSGDFAVITLSARADPNATESFLFRKIGQRSNGMLTVTALDDRTPHVSIPIDRILEIRRVLNWKDILE